MANLRADNLTGTGGRNAIDGSVAFSSSYGYLSTTIDAIGTSDFTIEWWFRSVDRTEPGTANRRMFRLGANNATGSMSINYDAVNSDIQWNYDAATILAASTIKVYDKSWYHIAVVREGTGSNETKLYINGVLSDSVTLTTNFSQTALQIGWDSTLGDDFGFYGNISNLRVTKSAVYTAAFTPPTEKYTVLTDTILLCCQDSMNPEQEATGKTITGYGDLTVTDNANLVGTAAWTDVSSGSASASGSGTYCSAVGSDLSNRGAVYTPCTVVVGKKYEFGFRTVAGITNCKIGVDSNDGTNDQRDSVGNNPDLVYSVSGDSTTITGRKYRDTFTATTTTADVYFQGVNGTLTADEIFLRLVDNSDKWRSNNELPPVGVDEGVTFSGDTQLNSQGYMYFPTGNTTQRGRGRGLLGGSNDGSPFSDSIQYINIQSQGNSADFGDLTSARSRASSYSSSTRGIWGGGNPKTNIIDYVTIATTSIAIDFGDLTVARRFCSGTSSTTRGLTAGGNEASPSSPYPSVNVIDYTTIASVGNATDFGDLLAAKSGLGVLSSTTRAVFGGGYGAGAPAGSTNDITYATIATTGNSADFGDLTNTRRYLNGVSSNIRGVFCSGSTPAQNNTIDFITIATTGNATDFGDATIANEHRAGISNSIRGVNAGSGSPAIGNTIDFITIATTGNAQDFGDTATNMGYSAGCSDSHGGL